MKEVEKSDVADGVKVKPAKNVFSLGYPDAGLKEPVRPYEETLSGLDVVAQRFFWRGERLRKKSAPAGFFILQF